jgi:translation initiation factor IF-2
MDDLRNPISDAAPSTPVVVTGFHAAPSAGERFFVTPDIGHARDLAKHHQEKNRSETLDFEPQITLESFFERRQQKEIRELNIILKADTRGSIEAIRQEMDKLIHPEVRIKLLHAAVGAVNDSDVRLADASEAVVIAFNVGIEDRSEVVASEESVQIRRYNIIYELVQDVRDSLSGLLAPERREVQVGRANILQVFRISRLGTIAGCRLVNGSFERNLRIRVFRDGIALGEYPMASLKREKDDVRSVREGLEFGVRLAGFDDLHVGDELEAFRIEEIARTL